MRSIRACLQHAPVLIRLAFGLVVLVSVVGSASAAPSASHTVTSTADSGPGTLRQAMLDANASMGSDVIQFSLSGCSPTCVIRPTIALPIITGGGIEIDGFSQTGSSPPTQSSPAVIRVALDGTDVENHNGLSITSAGNTVKGLAIHSFGWNGIAIGGPDAEFNIVWGNHIGLTAGGLGLASRRPNGFEGVFIGLGARSNYVGGDLDTQRNVISGNTYDGVAVHGPETRFNKITGNYIGTDASGTSKVPNAWDGVRLYGGSLQSRVGVIDDLGQRNIISGNDRDGVRIAGADTTASLDGNLIGTTASGTAALGNQGDGVHMMNDAYGVSIGTADTPSIGIISGNVGHGIHLESGQAVIIRQFIGLDLSGTNALPNEIGIRVATDDAMIGGLSGSEGNLISGNRSSGILITGAAAINANVRHSMIGVDSTGSAALGNGAGGVRILDGATDNTVGGDGHGNVISGNAGHGVEIDGAGTDDNKVWGNTIGIGRNGESDVGNAQSGVHVGGGATGTRIGAFGGAHGNWIGGNTVGVSLQGAGAGTYVYANRIGAGETGPTAALGNDEEGVKLDDGTVDSRLDGNTIIGNGSHGVNAIGASTVRNLIIDGSISDNDGDGIELESGAHGGIQPPVLVVYDVPGGLVSGTACNLCKVIVYSDDGNEGRQLVGDGAALGDGKFTVVLTETPLFANLTATASDSTLGTSEFSVPLPAAASTETPTSTVTPTTTVTSIATASGTSIATASGTSIATASGTSSPTATQTSEASATPSPTGLPETLAPTSAATESPTNTSTAGPSPTASRAPSFTPFATWTREPSATWTSVPSATGTPASGTPATGTPASGTPATGTPATGTPATQTPVGSATRTPEVTESVGPPSPATVYLPIVWRPPSQ